MPDVMGISLFLMGPTQADKSDITVPVKPMLQCTSIKLGLTLDQYGKHSDGSSMSLKMWRHTWHGDGLPDQIPESMVLLRR